MTAPACRECRFWHSEMKVEGECRRHPPRWRDAQSAHMDDDYGAWPITSEDGWCGEFAPRAPEKYPCGVCGFVHADDSMCVQLGDYARAPEGT